MTRRLPDWRDRLDAEIQRKALCAFAWGLNDCCLFACDLVRAMTGRDYAEAFRGRYSTPIGAARALRNVAGVSSLPDLVDKLAAQEPWEEISPDVAASGDWTLAAGTHGPTLAVRYGRLIATPGLSGVELLPASRALRAWIL